MKFYLVAAAAACISLSACETSVGIDSTTFSAAALSGSPLQIVPAQIPVPVVGWEVYDAALGKRKLVDVRSLTAKQLRQDLSATRTFITVEKQNASGKFDILGSGASAEKGVYRITFDYVNSTTQEITGADNQKLGLGEIGVGLRMVASINNVSGKVNLSGLLPVGLAAEAGKINGILSLQVLGLSNDKLALAVPGQLTLDASGIQKAFEAAAAVRVLFVDDATVITPWVIGVSGVPPNQAKMVLDAAAQRLAQNVP